MIDPLVLRPTDPTSVALARALQSIATIAGALSFATSGGRQLPTEAVCKRAVGAGCRALAVAVS